MRPTALLLVTAQATASVALSIPHFFASLSPHVPSTASLWRRPLSSLLTRAPVRKKSFLAHQAKVTTPAVLFRRVVPEPVSLQARDFHLLRAFVQEKDAAFTPDEERKAIARIRTKYHAPRHPIILCHGLLGFDVLGPPGIQLHYWRGIAEALRVIGADVIVTKVPRAADVSVRAQVLKDIIQERLPPNVTRVNVIGHSMGGLDARYMISKLLQDDPPFHVESLTTIATPHRGSEIAALLQPAVLFKVYPSLLKWGLDLRAFENLTPTNMQEHFNKEVLDDPSVAYFSYGGDAAVSIGDKWIHWLKWFHAHLLQSDGPNDGLVSIASAKWGKYLGTIQTDHVNITNLYALSRWSIGKASQEIEASLREVTKELEDHKSASSYLCKHPEAHTLSDEASSTGTEGEAEQMDDGKTEQGLSYDTAKVLTDKGGHGSPAEREIDAKAFNAIEFYLEVANSLYEEGH